MVGVVSRWDPRGFGFISTQAHSVFVHRTQVAGGRSLEPGDLVEFTRSESPRGPCATSVSRLPPTCAKCDQPLRQIKCPRCGYLAGA